MIDSADLDERLARLEANRSNWNMCDDAIGYIITLLAERSDCSVLEIGTHNGFSALHWAKWSDHIVTIERDAKFAALAKENFDGTNIELVVADALEYMPTLDVLFDVIVIDAQKSEYDKYLRVAIALLRPDGVIAIDNTISHKDKLQGLFDELEKSQYSWEETGIGQGLIIVRQVSDA